ncbi:MAG: hypothetical protein HDR12_06980 [Lachnospiraceae bacterium]|nr:hypothetical protein [Lachnospiraceae bacterium]
MVMRANHNLKKMAADILAAGLCVLAMSGCSSAEPQEEVVVVKEQNEEFASGQTMTEEEAVSGNVAEQVQAPEFYQAELSSDVVTVKADAVVTIPDVPGIKLKKVTARTFTPEDYDVINRVLLGGEGSLNIDNEALSGGGEEAFTGDVMVNGQDYWLQIDNNATAARHRVKFMIEKQDGNGDYLSFSNSQPDPESLPESMKDIKFIQGFVNMNTPPEEIMNEVTEAVNQMGIGEYSVQGGGYFACWIANEDAMSISEYLDSKYLAGMGYGVHLYRVEDGIPITYTYEDGGMMADYDAEKLIQAMENGEEYVPETVYWPYEEMTFIYTNEGLRTFEWINPYIIENLSDEYVFLLPFSDISNIFEDLILKKYADSFNNEGDTVDIQVDKVVLSYMRVREKDSMEGTLIPVWDFFGTKTYKNSAGEVDLVVDRVYDGVTPESMMTINAMDGTIVYRGLGY